MVRWSMVVKPGRFNVERLNATTATAIPFCVFNAMKIFSFPVNSILRQDHSIATNLMTR